MNEEEEEYIEKQEDSQIRGSAATTGLSMAADLKQRTVHNENFLNELRKPDIDADNEESAIEKEFADWFSGAKAVTNRGDDWDMQADLLMMNKRERALAERRPGRLLRDRPFLLATMQGADTPAIDAYLSDDIPGSRQYWIKEITERVRAEHIDFEQVKKPATSKDQSKIYGGAEVAADLMALSRNAAGLESVSTVKTETNVRRQEEEETTGSRVAGVFE